MSPSLLRFTNLTIKSVIMGLIVGALLGSCQYEPVYNEKGVQYVTK